MAWLLVLLSGPLIALSQHPANVPLLGLVGLVPLFLVLPHLSRGGAWLAGWVVGLCYFWGDMWWLGQMVTDPGKEWIIFAMFAFVATVMAAYWGVAAMATRWLMTRRAGALILAVPLVWLGIEYMHEFNTPAPYPWLPLGMAITELSLFLQTADIFGQYGLTLAVVLTNLGIARTLELRPETGRLGLRKQGAGRIALPVAAALVLASGSVYGFFRAQTLEADEAPDGPVIALVQGNLSQEVKVGTGAERRKRIVESYSEHMELSQQAARQHAELICWAETMLFGGATRDGLDRLAPQDSALFFDKGVPSRKLLQPSNLISATRQHNTSIAENFRARLAYEIQTPMLVGAITDIPAEEQDIDWKKPTYDSRVYNTSMLFDGQGRVSDSYDKRYLVPGGEYVPLEHVGLVRAIVEYYSEGLQGAVSRVEPGRRLTTFRLPSQTPRLEGRDWAFTSTICYEYAWPGCYAELHEKPARYPDFHVNISNEGWFKQSAELDQAMEFCRLRCIENRMPMVRATNTGISAHIDALGRTREVLTVDGKDREVKGLLLVQPAVLKNPQPTMFVAGAGWALAQLALWFTVGILGLMAAGRVHEIRHRRRGRKAQAAQDKANTSMRNKANDTASQTPQAQA